MTFLVYLLTLSLSFSSYIEEGNCRKITPQQIGDIFEMAAKFYPKTAPPDAIQVKQDVQYSKNITLYNLVGDDEAEEDEPTFIRYRVDKPRHWMHIPKSHDHLFKWENQTIVVLKLNPGNHTLKSSKVYSVLELTFR
jgi:hypothetical protein